MSARKQSIETRMTLRSLGGPAFDDDAEIDAENVAES
jgi:hypothetical protein